MISQKRKTNVQFIQNESDLFHMHPKHQNLVIILTKTQNKKSLLKKLKNTLKIINQHSRVHTQQ